MDKFSKLTRDEMKHVLGGEAPINDGCPDQCQSDSDCKDGKTCTMVAALMVVIANYSVFNFNTTKASALVGLFFTN